MVKMDSPREGGKRNETLPSSLLALSLFSLSLSLSHSLPLAADINHPIPIQRRTSK